MTMATTPKNNVGASSSKQAGIVVVVAAASGVVGMAGLFLFTRFRSNKRRSTDPKEDSEEEEYEHPITTLEELRKVIPASKISGSTIDNATKVLRSGRLDDLMKTFINQSPFVVMATSDAQTGMPFISPKGDHPGFVRIHTAAKKDQLVIPDRPGNRLVFGFQNLVGGNPNVGLLFQIPGNETTLRIHGKARLYRDPKLCQEMKARGINATLVVVVDVEKAYFHCSKAYIRSKLWKIESWPKEPLQVKFGKYFSSLKVVQNKFDQTVQGDYEIIRQSTLPHTDCSEPSSSY